MDIPAEFVRAEIVIRAGRLQTYTVIGLGRIVRGKYGCEDTNRQQGNHHDCANGRRLALQQLVEGIPGNRPDAAHADGKRRIIRAYGIDPLT